VPLAVVEEPPAFPSAAYEGLEADEWPPLLHPRMLMDEASYEAWEAHVVWRCATVPGVWAALATIRRDAEILRAWRPGGVDLLRAVHACRDREPVAAGPPDETWVLARNRDALSMAPGAPDLTGVPDIRAALDALQPWEPTALRLIAAHAFASWCAYQGRGLAAHVRSLETAAAVLVVESARVLDDSGTLHEDGVLAAVSATDFLLRHQASREGLAALWSRREAGV